MMAFSVDSHNRSLSCSAYSVFSNIHVTFTDSASFIFSMSSVVHILISS